MGEKLAVFAQRKLAQRGVDIRFGSVSPAATGEAAILDNGERIETKTLVSTVPSSPHPLIQSIDTLPKSKKGKIEVDEHLQVKGTEDVWAVGDCAAIPLITAASARPPRNMPRARAQVAENILSALGKTRSAARTRSRASA